MKQNDIAALVLIVAITAVVAYFGANALIGTPQNDPVEIEKVAPISESFAAPDSRVFNDQALDPTVEIEGDGPSTDTPFTN